MRSNLAAHRALLALILVVVALVTYMSHWDPDAQGWRPSPVHMDEYVHWGYSEAILDARSVYFRDPFSGAHSDGAIDSVRFQDNLHERGFQALLAVWIDALGVEHEMVVVVAPPIIAVILALGLYSIGAIWGAALPTAACAALIPTSLRYLGPGFLVPIAAALPFLLLALFLLFRRGHARTWVALAFVAGALWTIHFAVAAVVPGIILLFALASAREPARAAALAVLGLLPLLAAAPLLTMRFKPDPSPLPPELGNALIFGPLLFVLAGLGVARLAGSEHPGARASGIAIGCTILAGMWFITHRLETGEDPFGAYDRVPLLVTVLAAIPAGAALAAAPIAAAAFARRWRLEVLGVRVAALAMAALLIPVAAAGAATMATEPRYHVITPDEHAAFHAAREALGPLHRRAAVDGIATMPFSIITGRPTLFVATPENIAPPRDLAAFFAGGAADTLFLLQNDVTIVVTGRIVNNPDLRSVAPGVYVLRDDYAELLAAVAGDT